MRNHPNRREMMETNLKALNQIKIINMRTPKTQFTINNRNSIRQYLDREKNVPESRLEFREEEDSIEAASLSSPSSRTLH